MGKDDEERMRLMFENAPVAPVATGPPPGLLGKSGLCNNYSSTNSYNRNEGNCRDMGSYPQNVNTLHHSHKGCVTRGPPPGYIPPAMYGLNGNIPPPPGLPSPHLSQLGSPPGFYYPPLPPQQSHLCGIPQLSSNNFSLPNQVPNRSLRQPLSHYPYSTMLISQQQSAHLMHQPQPYELPNNSVSAEERNSGIGEVKPCSNNVNLAGDLKQTVIQPMIENIVGSMSFNTSGTYTPFGGPSVPITPINTVTMSSVSPYSSFGPSMPATQAELLPAGQLVTPTLLLQGGIEANNEIQREMGSVQNRDTQEEEIAPQASQRVGNAVKDGQDSRPQTPGKLSYSEILTKNDPNKYSSNTAQKASSAPSSNSPSPAPHPRNCDFGLASSAGSAYRRTSTPQEMQETPSSNSSSLSGSPTVKPKHTPDNFGQLKAKEKENSNSASKSSTAKSTPTGTPTHSAATSTSSFKSGKCERKILNSSSLNGQGAGICQGRSKVSVSTNKSTKGFQFEFDIEDEDENIETLTAGKNGKRGIASCPQVISSGSTPRNNAGNCSATTLTSTNGIVNLEKKTPSSSVKAGKNVREKNERYRGRKGGQNATLRRLQILSALWFGHLISAVSWLWSLVLNVGTLSCSLVLTMLEDGYSWCKSKAMPSFRIYCDAGFAKLGTVWKKLLEKCPWKKEDKSGTDARYGAETMDGEILSVMGPERNILLPGSGEEALKRLLSVKGQDPYSILGVRSDSSDETIRRYYKKQAVLVHPDKNVVPGAEEAFKILARAFELVGEPAKRFEYHRQLLEAHQKERVFGEIGNLLEQLRKKMESVTNTIRCTKCNSRHKKIRTDRPLFAARYCAQCKINHAAREGDLWAERKGLFGISRQYYACMESSVWEVNEWASCQKKNLKHLLPDSHNVMYRLVAGGSGCGSSSSSKSKFRQGPSNCRSSNDNPNSTPSDETSRNFYNEPQEPEVDDWDTLINNLCRTSTMGSGNSGAAPHNKQPSNVNKSGTNGSYNNSSKAGTGSSNVSGTPSGAGSSNGSGSGVGSAANSANSARRRGKIKRK